MALGFNTSWARVSRRGGARPDSSPSLDFDSTLKYEASFIALLDRVVQTEPWIPRDRPMVDQLRTIGIEKGKPFAPDDTTKKALETSVEEARR